jgi:hypothetical protein
MVGRGLHRSTGHDGPEDAESLDVEHVTDYTAALHVPLATFACAEQ